jgi:hypothetical protein
MLFDVITFILDKVKPEREKDSLITKIRLATK